MKANIIKRMTTTFFAAILLVGLLPGGAAQRLRQPKR